MLYWAIIVISCFLVLWGSWRVLQAWLLSRYVTALVLGGEQKALGREIWRTLKRRWESMVKKKLPEKKLPDLNTEQEIVVIRDTVTRLMLGAAALFALAAFFISLVSLLVSKVG